MDSEVLIAPTKLQQKKQVFVETEIHTMNGTDYRIQSIWKYFLIEFHQEIWSFDHQKDLGA
jgi:hypothetical protein